MTEKMRQNATQDVIKIIIIMEVLFLLLCGGNNEDFCGGNIFVSYYQPYTASLSVFGTGLYVCIF